jgi:polar amino acid transport system substrate-binding protein
MRLPWLASALLCICQIILLLQPACAQPGGKPETARKMLKASIMIGPPWTMKDEDGHWTGITIDLLKEISEEMRVDYEFIESNLDGVQNAVANREVDLSAAGLAITAEREKRFDFSDPYFVFNQAVAVSADQQPNLAETIKSTFFSWGFLSVTLLMVALTLLGGTVFWLLEQRGDSEQYAGKDRKAFARSLFWSVIVLSGRDMPKSIGWSTHAPKTVWARCFAVVWMMVGILLFSLFTAGAASQFTSKQLRSIVSSREDLHRVRCGTVTGSAASGYMDRHNIKYATYKTEIELLDALVAHKIDAAVFASVPLSYHASHDYTNKIVVLNFSLRLDFAALAIPQGSPLRKPLNEAILHVLESKRWQTIVAKYISND